jgi:hypothetical protein
LLRLEAVRMDLHDTAVLWAVYPKGNKQFTENHVRDHGLSCTLVDVKVVRFSDTLTALKFVVPLAQRADATPEMKQADLDERKKISTKKRLAAAAVKKDSTRETHKDRALKKSSSSKSTLSAAKQTSSKQTWAKKK